MSQIASTYKARDVEETIDIYFYRPLGYITAKACKALGISPNAVTIISIVIGVIGGHFLYYRDLSMNTYGFILWVIADMLDSADGQLARMTDHRSKIGRILDGLGGNIIFVSIYLHLCARMAVTYPSVPWPLFFLYVLAGGISHSLQSSLADYYRNAYLKIVVNPRKSELEGVEEIRAEYAGIRFRTNPVRKIMIRIYLNYTIQQEALSKNFQRLRRSIDRVYGVNIPEWVSAEYRRENKPLMKYYAILTTNIRMIIMAFCVLVDLVPLYFGVEILLINLIMVLVTSRQEKLSAGMIAMMEKRGDI